MSPEDSLKNKKRNKKITIKSGGWIGLLVLSLLAALLLAACGEERSLVLPDSQPTGQIVPSVPTATPEPTATPAPEPTATPQPTATPEPTATPDATATPAPANTTRPTSRPTATPRPTVSTTPAPIDPAAELKIIKNGFDAINKNFYTQPDTSVIAQKGLEQAAQVLGLSPPGQQKWGDATNNWQLFEQRYNDLVSKATVQLPPGELAHQVVNVMANATGDLHTYFLDTQRSDAVLRQGRGDNSTIGFGISFIQYQGGYFVQKLITGSPADAAGVKVEDKLVSFNGAAISASNFAQLSRTKEGTTYHFVFTRPNTAQPLNIDIQAKRYTVPTAEWKLMDNHIGFITLNAFHLDVQNKLDEAIADLKQQGADSLIIDLRFNGGGYNFERVAGRFVNDGAVLGQFNNRGGTTTLKARSDGKQVTPPLPLVVLIDHNSASASEVFSLAIQDYNAGTIIGNKSAGAVGTVRFWPLGDGTYLGVTASIYQTVKGEKLNGIGVTPDITVVRSTADILAGRDPQLDAAVKHLDDTLKAKNP